MIVIGDVHGCYKTLLALIEKLPEDKICFTGDLIDRGPDSMKVVEFVKSNGHHCVTGNHEMMMVQEWPNVRFSGVWISNGGLITLTSYFVEENQEEGEDLFPPIKIRDDEKIQEHVDWMKTLPLYKEFKDVKNEKGECLLVSHSSASKVYGWSEERRKTQKLQFENNIAWSRPSIIRPIPGVYNIFGHTPCEYNPKIKSCYANADTGAVFTRYPEHGVLTAIQFPSMKVFQQRNIEE